MFLLTYLFPILAQAVVLSPGHLNCHSSAFKRNLENLHKIAVVGEDDRMTFEEFAKASGMSTAEVRETFSATATIQCEGGHLSTAQMVTDGKRMVGISSGHTHWNTTTCAQLDSSKCKIRFPHSGHETIYRIKKGSLKTGRCDNSRLNSVAGDWAVFEIQPPPKGIAPYKLPKPSTYIGKGTQLLAVAATNNNFKRGQEYPYTIHTCQVRDTGFRRFPLQTDCDTGGGASGHGQFISQDNDMVIAAIGVARTPIHPDGHPYDFGEHFNISVPVQGDFLKAIHEALDRQ